MARVKRTAKSTAAPKESSVATATALKAPVLPTSKIPVALRFPLAIILNLSLAELLYTISSTFTAGDLGSVKRSINDWDQIFGLVACKIIELGVSWYSGFDGYDVAALTFLTHLPPFVLLTTCYSVRPTTLLASLFNDVVATTIPFHALRRVTPAHADNAPQGSIANRSIISDLPTQIFMSLLGAGVHAFVVYSSYYTWLPFHLVTTFDGLRSIDGIYNTQFLSLALLFIPIGVATKVFLFTPATASKRDAIDAAREKFDPQAATLQETFWYNTWGFSKHSRVMISRTAVLAGVTFLYGWVQIYATIEGAEGLGAAGWAGVWATAAVVTGLAYGWVINVDGVN